MFDLSMLESELRRFAEDVPKLLESHHLTVDLCPALLASTQSLMDTLQDRPLTIAVVGQMKAGKSTLLNALVQKNLAIVGVTETTATINWFRYADTPQGICRVVWKHGGVEEVAAERIKEWAGNSELAAQTRYLEYFVKVPFLQQAEIVDTPGARSVLEAHESSLREFLQLRQIENVSRAEGDSADAILYVMSPGSRKSDVEFLADFEQATRLPGASPYNSLGILHKWESLNVADPWRAARETAERFSARLKDAVSTVIPVSGPMGWAAEQLSAESWEQLHFLIHNSNSDALKELLLDDRDFREFEMKGCCLRSSDRSRLVERCNLPWPSLRMIISVGINEQHGSVDAFRQSIHVMSGLPELRRILQQRFLDRGRLIKSMRVLSRCWAPTATARIRLRNHKQELFEALATAREVTTLLQPRIDQGDRSLEPVLNYVRASQNSVEREFSLTESVDREIDELSGSIGTVCRDLDLDVSAMDRLSDPTCRLGVDLRKDLSVLFGAHGLGADDRLRPWFLPNSVNRRDAAIEGIHQIRKRVSTLLGKDRDVCRHAIRRLEQIADFCQE